MPPSRSHIVLSMRREDLPIPEEGIIATHFVIASDIGVTARFYETLGGEIIYEGQGAPTFVKLANTWVIVAIVRSRMSQWNFVRLILIFPGSVIENPRKTCRAKVSILFVSASGWLMSFPAVSHTDNLSVKDVFRPMTTM